MKPHIMCKSELQFFGYSNDPRKARRQLRKAAKRLFDKGGFADTKAQPGSTSHQVATILRNTARYM